MRSPYTHDRAADRSGLLDTLRQFTASAGVGAIGTAIHYLTLVLLVSGIGVDALASSAVGSVAGAVINYILNYSLVFRSRRRHREALWRFMAVAAAGLAINAALMAVLLHHFGAHYLVAQLLATGAVLIWIYTANRLWTFRESGRE